MPEVGAKSPSPILNTCLEDSLGVFEGSLEGCALLPLALEDLVDIFEDSRSRKRGVHLVVDSTKSVVAGKRSRLLVISFKTLLQSLGVVVASSNERLAGDVVGHGDLWRVEFFVVAAATGEMDHPSADAPDEQAVIDGELNHSVELRLSLLQQAVELLSLNDGSREAIEQKSVLALGLVQV